MASILAIIPARGGSKGVFKKNIRKLNDKHLIGYTIEAAKRSKYVDRVVVSTDDEEIARIASLYNAEVPCLRPKEMAMDNSPTIDAILHMINYLENKEEYYPEYIMLLQCTTPFRNETHIDEAVEKLLGSEFDGVVSVREVEENPYWSNVFVEDRLEYFLEEGRKITRRQDLPPIYTFNGAIYLVKTDVLKKEKSLEPKNLTGYIMGREESLDIDTEIDFKMAQILIEKL